MRHRWKTALTALLLLIVSVAGAAGAAATTNTSLLIGTHNVFHVFDADGTDINAFAGVIGWQEMDEFRERERLRDRLPGYEHYFPEAEPAKAVPISWRKDRFEKVLAGNVRTHDGEAEVTPARYITWVKLQDRDNGNRFLVLNTHFISGAWNQHPERQARWLTHYEKLKALIGTLNDNHPNSPIFVVGDFNRAMAMAMPRGVDYIHVRDVSGVPIDQCYAQKPELRTWTQVDRLPMWGSDHHAYRFSATF